MSRERARQSGTAELRDDDKTLTADMRDLHAVTDEADDVSTTSLLEAWIHWSEERTWFLYASTRDATDGGHRAAGTGTD